MQLTAKLILLLPKQTGSGKNGEWKKQDIIVETVNPFPKKICVTVWGDKVNENQLLIGNKLKIDYVIESREYNGKWFTNVTALNINALGSEDQDTYPEPNDDEFFIVGDLDP